MNAGLTNLTELKKHLLPQTLGAGEDRFDDVIVAIGLAVAGQFDGYLNRKLAYRESEEIIFTGERSHYVLPRYPLVSVASVQSRYSDSDPWEDVTGEPTSKNPASGMIRFSSVLGDERLQVKVVWAGGYWFDTLDPDDDGYPGTAPAGVATLPNELRGAFFLQCRAMWQAIDKLGADILSTGSSSQFVTGSLSGMDLSPAVKQMLNPHMRYQLS